ncbi:MAG: c-type cytochrome [Phycisphaerales bacterium]|nr:c-type cytochrome [Phycisphaerales bacterium]
MPTVCVVMSGCDRSETSPTSGTAVSNAAAEQSWLLGEVLVSDSNCVACHSASATIVRRLGNAPAPVILGDRGVGSRLSADAIEARLQAHGEDLGQRMPDLLHGMAAPERKEASTDLVHFLVSQGGPLSIDATDSSEAMIRRGEELYREVGCIACHGPQPDLAGLASAWTHASLAAFLESPLDSHPSGRMPSMHLTRSEAGAIATFLLTNQAQGPNGLREEPRPGLELEFFKGTYEDGGPVEETRIPDQKMRVDVPGIGPGANQDNFGVRIRGNIDIPTSGRWSFWLRSDDGSRFYLDGEPLILHDGVHGATDMRGSAELDAGPHELMITMFERGGGEELSLSWSGPGRARERVPASAFSSSTTVLRPAFSMFEPNQDRVARGEALFMNLGCVACHAPDFPKPSSLASVPPFTSLVAGRGCLANDVPANAPAYGFTDAERAALDEVVANAEAIDVALAPDLAVAHTMTRLNCVACHSRDDVGGPGADAKALFLSDGDAELGDEGRIPPALDGVGGKLRLSALRETLLRGEKIRPYMQTRMPSFGAEQVADLVVHLAAADMPPGRDKEPEFSVAAVDTGRALVGMEGVSCIQCHTAAGIKSLGVPAIDLTDMHQRLRPAWFKTHLLDPQKTNPGTRMTAFWGNGGTDRIFPEHLGGDPEAQVEAIYTYLSLGDSMPLPKGIVPDGGQYLLTPSDEPILFGTFMEDVSPRTIAVGLPENAHYAYDMENGRLATCWRGAFMNAEGTWHGRAGQLESPGGNSMIRMPPGSPIAALPDRGAAWPEADPRDAAGRSSSPWQVRGVERDSERRPIFNMEMEGVRVKEEILPRLAPGGTRLIRRFTIATDEGRGDLFMRAAITPTIEAAGGEGRTRRWTLAGGRIIDVRGAESFVREDPNGIKELLVKVPLTLAGRKNAKFEGVFEVEMDW